MNQDNDNSSTTDDRLSAAYRALATESAPHKLNHAVLKQAKAALPSGRPRRRPLPLLRSLAFAATAGISLAIVLQLGDTSVGTPPELTDSARQEPPGARSGDPASKKREPVQAGGIANTGRLRQERAAAPPAIRGDSLVGESGRYCDDEQSASAARWLVCIENLQRAGKTEEAEYERRLLLRAFPETDAAGPN